MKNETSDYYTWDDVVFENRNKSYGAYLVRQSYSRNSMIAFGASVSFAILLIFSPQIINYLTGGKVKIPDLVVDVNIKDKVVDFIQPPTLDLPKPPPASEVNTVIKDLPPQVVTHEVETVIPPNSELLANENIDNGDGVVFTESTTIEPPVEVISPPKGPVDFAEEMPEYIGGRSAMMKLLSKHFKYPKSASAMGVEGTVYVSFVIDADGNVVDVKVVKSVSADCDKEAIKLISLMPQWKAGKQNHQPVSVRMILPIKFQINQ